MAEIKTNTRKNIAVIFAGGVGKRMNSTDLPKQFLKCKDKPVIVYTLEKFNNNPLISGIVLVMLKDYIDYSKELIKEYKLDKVIDVVEGGETCQDSIYNGIKKAHDLYDDAVVLIHDGVRPLIDDKTIEDNINSVINNGSAITVSPAFETITIKSDNNLIEKILDRSNCQYARAPQSFFLKDIYDAHLKAINENKHDFIDSAFLMTYYGHSLYSVVGNPENIKITTPNDYYMFCSLIENKGKNVGQ